jgi:cupin fold WbuC family metalloprotein
MILINNAKTTTYSHADDIVTVTPEIISKLKIAASKDHLGRARFCLHRDYTDKVQEMIIVLKQGTYVRPHRHVGKTESFHMIDGKLKLFFFNDAGKIIQSLVLESNRPRLAFVYRLSVEIWHMAIPLTKYAIFHETITGPFTDKQSEFASWSPAENDLENIKKYLGLLLSPESKK